MNLTYTNALISDLPGIVDIYNSTIASRMVTADTHQVSVENKVEWFHQHNADKRPLWVISNEHQEMIGWASFQSFYGRPAYNHTVEISIYLHELVRGKGLGKVILAHCLESAPALDIHTMLGFIFQHNVPSLQLFYHAGFSDWGTFPNVAVIDGIERTLIIVGKRL